MTATSYNLPSPQGCPASTNMPTETTGRPLLPQTAQMQSFTFAPPTLAPRENQRSQYPDRTSIIHESRKY